ncbi:hypothetical protein TVAG_392110 [Trichomonas vaginalis G3]|uniref:Integrase catalytic domain-containing protein n=1 Tax=Trichomonas vaginalis (strain ATCC PRA-98 / G3) TaxID=412133 RepID=A2DWR2_TRIV3|nr:exportin 1/5 family [Trichomonas vaginalis G3]EAY15094.1 hypothetical protein TVAG_392110 [Trichomonas vaginalis G3]KAI5499224.1 exportin 1/5 family [Trichomonas vaginalis G3]|eukprot:XP_001327317.1 hypothetical protein [Trichomonas vaginalis G3]
MWNDLLNEQIPIDINVFNSLITKFNTTQDSEERERLNQLILSLNDRSDTYNITIPVMESDFPIVTKLSILVIFKKFVITNLNNISAEEQTKYKDFFMNILYYYLENNKSQVLITKIDEIIVEFAKKYYPEQWPNFFSDIYSQNDKPQFFKNAIDMTTMLLLEVTNYDSTTIPASDQIQIQEGFKNESDKVFEMISNVFDNNYPEDIILSTLSLYKTLFEIFPTTDLIQNQIFERVCNNYLLNQQYTLKVLPIFNSFQASNILDQVPIIQTAFNLMITSLQPWFPDGNLVDISYEDLNTIIFSLTKYISNFSYVLESDDTRDAYVFALTCTFSVYQRSNQDSIRMCTEMWYNVTLRIYHETIFQNMPSFDFYVEAFKQLRRFMVFSMERPNDVIITVDENGVHVRSQIRTESTSSYYVSKDLMSFLTGFDKEDTISVINESITYISSSEPFLFGPFESLCYCIGSLRGSFSVKEENDLISKIISYLLQLIESRPEEEVKAATAAGLMYICSQYTRYLKEFPEILISVMKKLVEFTALGNEALQDASIKAMISIASACSEILCKPFSNDSSFLNFVIENFSSIFENLTSDNTIEMFHVIALIVVGLNDEEELQKYLEMLISSPFQTLQNHSQNLNLDGFDNVIQSLMCIDKIGYLFGSTLIPFLEKLMPILVNLYQVYSKIGNDSILESNCQTQISVNSRILKSTILSLIEKPTRTLPFLERIWNLIQQPLFEVFVPDFHNSQQYCRPSVLLNLLAVVCLKYREFIVDYLPQIFEQVFEAYRDMIDSDDYEFTSFRKGMNIFLKNLIMTGIIYTVPPNIINLCIEYLQYNAHDIEQEVSESAIRTLAEIYASATNKLPQNEAMEFQKCYVNDLCLLAFSLLTDSLHRYEFFAIMDFLREIIASNAFKENIVEIVNSLLTIFEKLSPTDIYTELEGLKSFSNQFMMFNQELNDFLIAAKQVSPRDPALVKVQMETLKKQKQEEEKQNMIEQEKAELEKQEKNAKVNDFANMISNFKLHS